MDNLLIPKNSEIVSGIIDLIKNHSLVLKINQMFLSKEEKERRVIDLYYYNQGKTFLDIAKELGMSLNAKNGYNKEQRNNSIVTTNKRQSSSLIATKAYELFF
jgi:DNA-directed RNA polymerase specialized sigma subunit